MKTRLVKANSVSDMVGNYVSVGYEVSVMSKIPGLVCNV